MGPTDYRLAELAEEARVRPSHVFHLIQWLSAGNPPEMFAAFARLEQRHTDQMLAALQAHELLPSPKRRRGTVGSSREVRATRLPPAMQLPDDWLAFAQQTRRWEKAAVELEFQTFLDYWHAQPGSKGVKLNWLATWRNWVRRSHTADGNWTPATAAPERRQERVWLWEERQRLDKAPYDPVAEAEWQRRRNAEFYGGG